MSVPQEETLYTPSQKTMAMKVGDQRVFTLMLEQGEAIGSAYTLCTPEDVILAVPTTDTTGDITVTVEGLIVGVTTLTVYDQSNNQAIGSLKVTVKE